MGRAGGRGPEAGSASAGEIIPSLLEALESQRSAGASGKPEDLKVILARERRLALLGDPGSGKTTLLKWLARTYALGPGAVKERLGLTESLLPIVVPIGEYANHVARSDSVLSPSEFIRGWFNEARAPLGDRLLESIEEGKALLLFDGLDEVVDTTTRMEVARRLQGMMEALAARGASGGRCVVTSRIYGYELCRLREVSHWELAPFSKEQVENFVTHWSWALERAFRAGGPLVASERRKKRATCDALSSSQARPSTRKPSRPSRRTRFSSPFSRWSSGGSGRCRNCAPSSMKWH